MSTSSRVKNPAAIAAALAWLAVPALMGAATVADRTQDWEESPQSLYMIGVLFIALAGVLTFLAINRYTRSAPRSRVLVVATVFYGLGFVVTVGMAWAGIVWMAFYAVAALTAAAAINQIRPELLFAGGSMVAAIVAQLGLTALKLGTPDSFGDYPIAWTTSFLIATLGAAAAMYAISRQQAIETSERVEVAA